MQVAYEKHPETWRAKLHSWHLLVVHVANPNPIGTADFYISSLSHHGARTGTFEEPGTDVGTSEPGTGNDALLCPKHTNWAVTVMVSVSYVWPRPVRTYITSHHITSHQVS